jgi:thiosulfate dehydrogenase [quinone] large subunit
MSSGTPAPAQSWRWALVAVRSLMGITYLSNGLAKLFGFSNFSIGPWSQFLINRDGAHGILASNVSHGGIGVLNDFARNVVLPHWDVIGWVLTAGELAVDLGLLFGIFARLAALGGFLMSFMLFLWALGGGFWTYDYVFEPVLLGVLALTPGLPGLDSLVVDRIRDRPPKTAAT